MVTHTPECSYDTMTWQCAEAFRCGTKVYGHHHAGIWANTVLYQVHLSTIYERFEVEVLIIQRYQDWKNQMGLRGRYRAQEAAC